MNQDGVADKDFEKKVKMAELLLKEQELQLKQDKEMVAAKTKAEIMLALIKRIQDQLAAVSKAEGPKGEKGERGERGPAGPQGVQGIRGPAG